MFATSQGWNLYRLREVKHHCLFTLRGWNLHGLRRVRSQTHGDKEKPMVLHEEANPWSQSKTHGPLWKGKPMITLSLYSPRLEFIPFKVSTKPNPWSSTKKKTHGDKAKPMILHKEANPWWHYLSTFQCWNSYHLRCVWSQTYGPPCGLNLFLPTELNTDLHLHH